MPGHDDDFGMRLSVASVPPLLAQPANYPDAASRAARVDDVLSQLSPGFYIEKAYLFFPYPVFFGETACG
jgi:hypothetical protein